MTLYLKLKRNISTAGDIELARREARALSGAEPQACVNAPEEIVKFLPKIYHSRNKHEMIWGFELNCSDSVVPLLAKNLAFYEIIVSGVYEEIKTVKTAKKIDNNLFISIVNSYLIEIISYSQKLDLNFQQVQDFSDSSLNFLLNGETKLYHKEIKKALVAIKTTLYLSHDMHVYKAKFFPRFVRSLINISIGDKISQGRNVKILDPFVGSGTTLLEASSMGIESYGTDVDPISVEISYNKVETFTRSPKTLYNNIEKIICDLHSVSSSSETKLFETEQTIHEKAGVEFPEPMRSRIIKRGREDGVDYYAEMVKDASILLSIIEKNDSYNLSRLILSHSLTKKIRTRFVGVGNGRFTFDVALKSVFHEFYRKMKSMRSVAAIFYWTEENINLFYAPTHVVKGSAMNLNQHFVDKKFDLIITSPPYLPASSGREHYARARGIPLVIGGFSSESELENLDRSVMGEMEYKIASLSDSLPQSSLDLINFLRDDPQRNIKSEPTKNYLLDLKLFFDGLKNVLRHDGIVVLVVAKSNTFYIHKTKEIVFSSNTSVITADIAQLSGFELIEMIDVELVKSGGLNARPRSTDLYYETAILLRLPL